MTEFQERKSGLIVPLEVEQKSVQQHSEHKLPDWRSLEPPKEVIGHNPDGSFTLGPEAWKALKSVILRTHTMGLESYVEELHKTLYQYQGWSSEVYT